MDKLLANKVAIITGANQGLGLEISKKYVAAGASIMMCARNPVLLEVAAKEVRKLASDGQNIHTSSVDVSQELDVDRVVKSTLSKLGGCHILVNNAGIYGPKGEIESLEWDEWRKVIEINLYGPIFFCQKLIPHFKKQRYGKVIQLSGGGATNPLPNISAYATSKAAVVRFAETLSEEVKRFGIDVNSIAPGALNTRMLDEVLNAGPEKVGKEFYLKSLNQRDSGGASIERAAELALFLASTYSNGITGKLISAGWDNWEEWPNHVEDLRNSDAYTLRRITGRDRNLEWGDL